MGNFDTFTEARDLINKKGTNISICFATISYPDDYDPSLKNYTYTNLPPKTIKGYITQLTPEKLVWKNYGIKEMGAIEILCDEKYASWFKTCNSVVANGKNYRVFKFAQGKLALIQDRAAGIVKITLEILS